MRGLDEKFDADIIGIKVLREKSQTKSTGGLGCHRDA